MHQISLGHLVEHVSPSRLYLLTESERTKYVVLRNGVENVGQEDVEEIMEAVITELAEDALYH
ncbi:hypothetical protein [Alkalicoccus urumqiensis]|uniref:Uncharacterized protein n=1 Tax=Alkalicoccus urumqiensis TaxID=1548213 RepID=A0A2P6MGK3_ALKUR|nr:hypothetical protein [Alkalicoccus urumqiensis]PRO65401.1 hypothetical protein C6I21_09575 [Alkalicoccus urumqiensis]